MNIRTVSAVGTYPRGASPYGCEEMSGNVREWTRSLFKAYPYLQDADGRRRREGEASGQRMLRGGSFGGGSGFVRCACRYDGDPGGRAVSVGFRVALSPLL